MPTSSGGAVGELGKGNIGNAIGNLFGGNKAPANTATNAPATNAAPANPLNNLFNNPFFKKK